MKYLEVIENSIRKDFRVISDKSDFPASHAGDTGSSPVGTTKNIKQLDHFLLVVSNSGST